MNEELKNIDAWMDIVMDGQEMFGKDYQRKLKALQDKYHYDIITSNKAAVEQHMKRTEITGQKNYVVRCRYRDYLDEDVDCDAFWLAPREPKIGEAVRFFDRSLSGIGDLSGTIIDMYELPGDPQRYTTIAVPYHNKPFWSVNYFVENQKDAD